MNLLEKLSYKEQLIAIVAQTLTATVVGADISLKGCTGIDFSIIIGADASLSGANHVEFVLEVAPDDGAGAAGTYVALTDNENIHNQTFLSGGTAGAFKDIIANPGAGGAIYSVSVLLARVDGSVDPPYEWVRLRAVETGTVTGLPISASASKYVVSRAAVNT
jgi:hypothetical protein